MLAKSKLYAHRTAQRRAIPQTLDNALVRAYMYVMTRTPQTSTLELMLRSDFARADPERARTAFHENRIIARKPLPRVDKPR